MNKPNAKLDLINTFPDTVSKNYKEIGADEVRSGVKDILSSYKGMIPDEKLAEALDRLEKKFPQGRYMGKESDELETDPRSVNLGLSLTLIDQLQKEIFGELDPKLTQNVKDRATDAYGDNPRVLTDSIFQVVKMINVLAPHLRNSALKHACDMTSGGMDDFIYYLEKAINILQADGLVGLDKYEHEELGWH